MHIFDDFQPFLFGNSGTRQIDETAVFFPGGAPNGYTCAGIVLFFG
jgi:hypothetical protein